MVSYKVMEKPGRNPSKITILTISVNNLTLGEVLRRVEKMVSSQRPHQIVTVNPEFLVLAQQNVEFRKVLQKSALALADGVGLQVAAFLQKKRFVERLPGVDLLEKMVTLAAKKGWRVFFLGAAPGVAEKAARRLKKEYPTLKIAASGEDPTPRGTKRALTQIKEFKPQLLFVAYGAPTQDLWIYRNKNRLGVPVLMGVGGALDYLSGKVPRSPLLLRRLGLEWLYRLFRQPWRWRRQLRLLIFLFLITRERLADLLKQK